MMRPIEETNRSLENIEASLKSIDWQLTKLTGMLCSEQEKANRPEDLRRVPRLLSTKEASEMTGLSEYELRRGFKEGIYPAIEIGGGESFKRLRWRSDLLEEAIKNR